MRQVVERGLGLTWQVDSDPYDLGLDALVGLALRDNPKRAQLVVSRVLGKHLPVAPADALSAGRRLAALVRDAEGALVVGYCETATGLGHVVAAALPGAHYVHTTRRPEPGVPAVAGFDEEHSHAVAHTLQLRDPAVLDDPDRVVVLVDDELTTGTTALNTVAALHARWPHRRYVVATLLDLRTPAVREVFADRAALLGVQVEVVALLSGALTLPPDAAERATVLRAELAAVPPAPRAGRARPGRRAGRAVADRLPHRRADRAAGRRAGGAAGRAGGAGRGPAPAARCWYWAPRS